MDGYVFLSGLRPTVLKMGRTSTVAKKEDVRKENILWLPGESLARVPYTSSYLLLPAPMTTRT